MKNKGNKKHKTITSRLAKASLLVIIPLLCYMFYSSYYSINLIHEQMAKSYKSMIALYMNQIDQEFGNINLYLINLAVKTSNNSDLREAMQETDKILNRIKIRNNLDDDLNMYNTTLDAIFVKAKNSNILTTSNVSSNESILMREYVIDCIKKKDHDAYCKWYLCPVSDAYYFLRVIEYDGSYVGAWVNSRKIMQPILNANTADNNILAFVSSEVSIANPSNVLDDNAIKAGRDIIEEYSFIDDGDYLLVNEQSTLGNFMLAMYIPNVDILQNLAILSKVNYVLLFFAIIMVILFIYLLKEVIVKPIRNILNTIHRISQGEMNARISPVYATNELQEVNSAFNTMMYEINQLKIDVYEEQLKKEKAQFKQLQLQTNPHFLINSLNIIYNLAQTNNTDLVKKMAQYLFKFYQYGLYTEESDFVELQKEVDHVCNYLAIQELRYPKKLDWIVNIPQHLSETLVPQFIIQTFVENTIKHGIQSDAAVSLAIEVLLVEDNKQAKIKITITDTGPGFPRDILERIQAGVKLTAHIGIWNIQQRLALLYKGNAVIYFQNINPSGAQVTILLPFRDKDLFIDMNRV